MKKPKDKKVTGKRMVIAAVGIITILLIGGTVFLIQGGHGTHQTEEKNEEIYQSLSQEDRETADLYAQLYETEREEVAKIQSETKDWEQTGRGTVGQNRKKSHRVSKGKGKGIGKQKLV